MTVSLVKLRKYRCHRGLIAIAVGVSLALVGCATTKAFRAVPPPEDESQALLALVVRYPEKLNWITSFIFRFQNLETEKIYNFVIRQLQQGDNEVYIRDLPVGEYRFEFAVKYDLLRSSEVAAIGASEDDVRRVNQQINEKTVFSIPVKFPLVENRINIFPAVFRVEYDSVNLSNNRPLKMISALRYDEGEENSLINRITHSGESKSWGGVQFVSWEPWLPAFGLR